ncbi:MAG: HD domain-containing protein [Chloroflexi bacterium]|nr:MAG: HD domain-containing protein [Chloroflexota bacterium]
MSTHVTNEGTGVDAPLEGDVSLLPPHADHPGLHRDTAFRSKRLTSPGAPAMRFERKVRRALNQRFLEVLTSLSARLHSKNEQLYDHSQRVLSLALCLLRVLDLSEEEVLTIALAAFFHDIGKIGIDNVILEKPLLQNTSL